MSLVFRVLNPSRSIIALLMLSGIGSVVAQTKEQLVMKKMRDSLSALYLDEFAKRQPMLRQGGVSQDYTGSGKTKFLTEDGTLLYKGDAEISRSRTNLNIPLKNWGKNRLSSSVVYIRSQYAFGSINNSTHESFPHSATKATMGLAASYSRTDSLFNQPVIFTGSINAITTDAFSIRRISYTGSMMFPLRQSQSTLTNLGVVLVANPSIIIPVPYFSYWHRYNSGFELDVQVPYGVSLRKPLSKAAWATVGSVIDPNAIFLTQETPTSSIRLMQNVLDLRTSLNIEHMIGKKLVVGVRGGLITNLHSRIQKDNAKPNDYLLRSSNNTVPFCNLSLSFLPFLKPVF